MSQRIVTERSPLDDFNPRIPTLLEDNDAEEYHPDLPPEMNGQDYIIFAVRILNLILCLVSLILILVNIGRGNRFKSWRLYFMVGFTVLARLALTLYLDCIDKFYVRFFIRDPQSLSIFMCFNNLFHGLSLYLVILLLAHLSDMQHRSHWLLLITAVLLVPLLYSVGILIADLRVHPDIRYLWSTTVPIDSVRVFCFNIITTVLLILMSRSFCTRTLYGTYSEQRSGLVVLVARWTYVFLLLHNCVDIAAYAVTVVTKVPSERDLEQLNLALVVLQEVALILITIAVPFSYITGLLAQCCCGISRDNTMEMDKVDKIYTDVWTTPSARSSSAAAASAPVSTNTSLPASNHQSGLQNGVVARRPQSRMNQGNGGSNSTLNSIDSIGELPRIATNPAGASNRQNKRVRESYMEAVSMGSLDDTLSSSSEPIDL